MLVYCTLAVVENVGGDQGPGPGVEEQRTVVVVRLFSDELSFLVNTEQANWRTEFFWRTTNWLGISTFDVSEFFFNFDPWKHQKSFLFCRFCTLWQEILFL